VNRVNGSKWSHVRPLASIWANTLRDMNLFRGKKQFECSTNRLMAIRATNHHVEVRAAIEWTDAIAGRFPSFRQYHRTMPKVEYEYHVSQHLHCQEIRWLILIGTSWKVNKYEMSMIVNWK
jgi:hypothetical protein